MRKNLYIALSIFSVAFWLWRIPFIIWLPIPEFGPDSFDYYSLVKAICDKTAFTYSIDLPLGYPVFLYLMNWGSSKAMVVIWVQFLLKFSAGLFLIYTCWRYYRWQAVLVSLALSIYVTDSWSLRYDTCFIPDSLYNSFLLITVALLIGCIKSPSKTSLAMLSTSMFLVAFTRSNGFFVYFIIPVMLAFLLPQSQRVLKYAALVAPAIFLHVAAYGFKSHSGILRPGSDRVNVILSQEAESLEATSGESYFRRKLSLAKEYFIMSDFSSFYFSLLPERYRQLYELDNIHDPDYKMFDWTTPISDDLRRLVYGEYYEEPALLKTNRNMMEVNYAYSHPWFLMIHIVYKIQNSFFRDAFWYLLGIGLFAFGCWVYWKSGFSNQDALLLWLLLATHFISVLIVIIGHPKMQFRYAHVTEFLLYLAPVFLVALVLPSYSERKN